MVIGTILSWLTPLQWIAVCFGLIMIMLTWYNLKRRQFDLRGSMLWFLLWAGLVVAIFFFGTISHFANTYLQVLPEDLFIFAAIFFLLGLSFNFFSKFQQTKKQLNEITSEIARRDAKKR